MAAFADALLLELLKAIQRSAPEPLYPGAFAAYSGLDRTLLDEALDYLRLRGLIAFTDWVQGKGQGYALTARGARVVDNPALLQRPPEPEPALPIPADATAWSRGEAIREVLQN